jgi:hypothetical protein
MSPVAQPLQWVSKSLTASPRRLRHRSQEVPTESGCSPQRNEGPSRGCVPCTPQRQGRRQHPGRDLDALRRPHTRPWFDPFHVGPSETRRWPGSAGCPDCSGSRCACESCCSAQRRGVSGYPSLSGTARGRRAADTGFISIRRRNAGSRDSTNAASFGFTRAPYCLPTPGSPAARCERSEHEAPPPSLPGRR